MAESIIYNLPFEVRPEHIETHIVPIESDGSIHLERIHFRAQQGSEAPNILAVGYNGIYYSYDGITWSHITGPFDGIGYLCCTYATHLNMWIVGPGYTNVPSNSIITSLDGTTWEAQTTPWDGLAEAWALAYSPNLELIVAIAQGRSAIEEQIMTSSDGVNWTVRSSYWDYSNGHRGPEDVGWIPFLNEFIMVTDGGSGDKVIGTSSNGITWTTQTTPFESGGANFLFGINHSSDTVFACGSFSHAPGASNALALSTDGITWTVNAEGLTPYNVYDMAYNSGVYVRGVNKSGISVQHSTNGTSWTDVSGSASLVSYINKTIWSPSANKFIAVGGDFAPGMLTSSDGTTWSVPSPAPGMLFDVWDINAT